MSWADIPQLLRLLAAMTFVLALMGGLVLILKKFGLTGMAHVNAKKKRLSMIEVLPLDNRRRAVLIQRDQTQHLVILGPNGETVVETNIEPVKDKDDKNDDHQKAS